MRIYSGAGIGDFYYLLLRDLFANGFKTNPRGRICLTMPEPVVLTYEEPGACLMSIPGRKFNIFFALEEVLWILAGSGNVDWISFFNENMRNFADPGHPGFHGSYGLRMRHWNAGGSHRERWDNERLGISEIDQIQAAASKIVGDPDTRQAVISLWDPARDNIDVSRDFPCNNLVYLNQRSGVLDLSVVIRSNDLIWGTPYNAIQFTGLLALLAGMTHLKMGKITYFVNNLHIYIDDLYKDTLEVLIHESRVSAKDPGALKIPFFEPTIDTEIQNTFLKVTEITKRQELYFDLDTPRLFWSKLLPLLAEIFTIVKLDKFASPELLAEAVISMSDPIPELIVDFYKDSKNEVARKVSELCSQRLPHQS
jgi:thymidylate synthase